MVPIAVSQKIKIFSPDDGRYAFYNSPYPGHKLSSSLDIFPNLEFNEPAPSPVAGEVVKIRKVKAPKGTNFTASKYDVVILIKSKDNPARYVKMLHIDPLIKVGETIQVGENFGTLLRSGYYGVHTGPHIHLEVRTPSDPLRARGGFNLQRILKIKNKKPIQELRGIVTKSQPERTFVKLFECSKNGVLGSVGDVPLMIDGGIPYGWVGGHYEDVPNGDLIKLAGKTIAKITKKEERYCTAECINFDVKVNNKNVGLFFYLYTHTHPEVMITSYKMDYLTFRKGEEIELIIE
jgi:hypothetical protein